MQEVMKKMILSINNNHSKMIDHNILRNEISSTRSILSLRSWSCLTMALEINSQSAYTMNSVEKSRKMFWAFISSNAIGPRSM